MKLTKEQKVLQQVINEAWQNEAFKAELLVNPVAAIENLTDEKLNLKGRELIVCDQTDNNSIYINIPLKQRLEDTELDEEQLEAISGGTDQDGPIKEWEPSPTFPYPNFIA